MSMFYPDVSAYNAGIPMAGAPAVCIKVTEGAGWVNGDYAAAMSRAAAAGAFSFAYHFEHAGNSAGQAAWCHSHAGTTPLMLDCEPTTGSNPTVSDAAAFCDDYRHAGGTITMVYLPRWYWTQMGSPSLAPLASRGLHLVSSAYTAYTDDPAGTGWLPYGGITPAVWQYADAHPFGGQKVDFNAYRGTLDQLKAAVRGSAPPPAPAPHPPAGTPAPAFPYGASDYLGTPRSDPHCHDGYRGGTDHVNVHTWQAQMAARGWTIAMDGCYGPSSEATAKQFQAEKKLAADGLVGPQTWSASWTAPVT